MSTKSAAKIFSRFGTSVVLIDVQYNIMTTTTTKFMKAIVTVIILSIFSFSAEAQTNTKSRIAVVTNDVKTNIWVSDFPKQSSVVVVDGENNILSMTSTNEYGAAFITLPRGFNSTLTVRTLNGEVSVSNKAVVKKVKEEENVVTNDGDDTNKA